MIAAIMHLNMWMNKDTDEVVAKISKHYHLGVQPSAVDKIKRNPPLVKTRLLFDRTYAAYVEGPAAQGEPQDQTFILTGENVAIV